METIRGHRTKLGKVYISDRERCCRNIRELKLVDRLRLPFYTAKATEAAGPEYLSPTGCPMFSQCSFVVSRCEISCDENDGALMMNGFLETLLLSPSIKNIFGVSSETGFALARLGIVGM